MEDNRQQGPINLTLLKCQSPCFLNWLPAPLDMQIFVSCLHVVMGRQVVWVINCFTDLLADNQE